MVDMQHVHIGPYSSRIRQGQELCFVVKESPENMCWATGDWLTAGSLAAN